MERWKRTNDTEATDLGIATLRWHTAISPRTGSAGRYFSLESADWVNVIPITPKGDVVLVRQYRHGTDSIILEIPGGIVEHGEDPQLAAAREMKEETGFVAERWIDLGVVEANPAFQTNKCHSFLALGCTQVSDQRLDGSEDIAIIRLPLQEVGRKIQNGEIQHAMVICAFFWYLQHGQPAGKLFAHTTIG